MLEEPLERTGEDRLEAAARQRDWEFRRTNRPFVDALRLNPPPAIRVGDAHEWLPRLAASGGQSSQSLDGCRAQARRGIGIGSDDAQVGHQPMGRGCEGRATNDPNRREREIVDESAGLGATAGLRREAGNGHSLPRPGERNEEQPALLRKEVCGPDRITDSGARQPVRLEDRPAGAQIGPGALLRADNPHGIPLQALGSMRGEDPHGI